MFQDDRMIPVLSVLLLMLVIGTMLQRADGLERWLGGEAPALVVLHDDEVSAPVNTLLRIDVFANDDGIDQAIRDSLTVVSAPACGRLNVRSGILEYLPVDGCEGPQTIRYSFTDAKPEQIAAVTARIRGATPVASASARKGARVLAEENSRPAPASHDRPAPALAEAPGQPARAPGPARSPVPVADGSGYDVSPLATSAPLPDRQRATTGPSRVMPENGPTIAGHPNRGERDSMAATAGASPQPLPSTGGSRSAGVSRRAGPPDAAAPSAPALAHASPPVGAIRAGRQSNAVARRPVAAAPSDPHGPSADPDDAAAPTSLSEAGAVDRAEIVAALRKAAGLGSSAATDLSSAADTAPAARSSAPGTSAPSRSAAAAGAGEAVPELASRTRAVVGQADEVPGDAEASRIKPRTAAARGPAIGDSAAGAPGPGGEVRIAALPTGTADAGVRSSVEPMRPGIRMAALLPPMSADWSVISVVPADHKGTLARRRPARPEPRAVTRGTRPALTPRPAVPRTTLPARPVPGQTADESPGAIAATGGPAFLLAVVGNGEGTMPGISAAAAAAIPPADGSNPHASGPHGSGPDGSNRDATAGGLRLAALAPAPLAPGPWLPGPALDVLPVVPEAPPPVDRIVMPVPRPAAVPGKPDSETASERSADPQIASWPESVVPCATVPGLTLDLRDAGVTVLGVDAPCQAGTVARVTYSGLDLAVPLDGNGWGSVTVLGFEPITPALVTFSDGLSLDFELPFRGIDRVSRVALAWDSAVELGLNALERGAAPNSPGHVRPGAARSIEQARQDGGGYLSVWWPVAGVGQSVQIYSWYHHRGESPGVVHMRVDFVSRDRDHLASACGNGPHAAPEFTVLRSEAGRPEPPVTRRLDPLDCGEVAEEGHDDGLISGAVEDLVITRR